MSPSPRVLLAAAIAATLLACTAQDPPATAPSPSPTATASDGLTGEVDDPQRVRERTEAMAVDEPPNLLDDAQARMADERGWTAQGNTTISLVSQPRAVGTHALRILVDPEGPFPDDTRTARVGTTPGTRGVPIEAGHRYEASWRLRPGEAPTTVRCELRWFDADGGIVDTEPGEFGAQSAGEWTHHACEGTAPPDAAFASVRAFIEDADYGDEHYLDDARLVETGTGAGPRVAEEQADEAASPAPDPAPASPAPDPAPTPGPRPPGDWPDGDSTGVPEGTPLEPSGSITVAEDGAVVEGLDVSGTITVTANDVTIRRTRVRTSGARYGISVASGARGTLIDEVTIVGTDDDCGIGIVHAHYTVRRSNISGCVDGLRVGHHTTVEGNYVHSLRWFPGAHTDALQSLGGSNIRIVGNTLEARWRESTAAIIMGTHNAPLENVLIEGNLLSGGTYTLYLGEKFEGDPAPSGVRFVDNVWVADSWKYGSHTVSSTADVTWSGNALSDGTPHP